MKQIFFAFIFSIFAFAGLNAQTNQTFNFDEMMKIRRVGDPQLSPDGKTVAFAVGDVNFNANRTNTQIYTVSIDGGNRRQLTKGDASNSSPRWSPDGKKIAYSSGGQLWTMDADGDDKKQVTKISTGAGNPVWSPDGRWIAFVSEVYPECATDECNRLKDEAAENNKVKAHVTERLLFKHWNEWRDVKRTHLFFVAASGGAARDLTPGDFDAPPYGASSGVDYAFSPDSKEIAYLRNPDKVEAISTNSDVYVRPLEGNAASKNITATNKGYDASPAYTPDGKYILFRSQQTEAFEADRWRVMRYNRSTGETIELTRGFDLQVDDMTVSPDGKTIYFTAGKRGTAPVFSVPVEPDARQKIATHVKTVMETKDSASSLSVTPDGTSFVYLKSSMTSPPEIFVSKIGSADAGMLSPVNTPWTLPDAEDVEWTGAMNAKVHGFLLKPADFDSSKKYPLLVLIHGGPQGAWSNNWGYRWNPQIFANAGYVVFMPNPRGSTGYGQKFVDEVSGDWGGKAYVDIMNGVAGVIKNPYIDKTRIGAAGASYGGYMVDWILGHNADPRFRFKTLVSHAGVYNLESMAATTEELWFTNWEFKGMPWDNPTLYQKWSPNKFIKNFNTPTLVTAGELDYRVPVDQSLQLYTALQIRNVPSKLVVFPDEGHWILKPQNSKFWYSQVLDWFDKHLKN